MAVLFLFFFFVQKAYLQVKGNMQFKDSNSCEVHNLIQRTFVEEHNKIDREITS